MLTELADKLKAGGKGFGEAQTKVAFIQPLLDTLGWNVADPDEVVLEHAVFGGTSLDYALLIDGQPKLYLEAKRLGASLSDPQFIAQTVNYANNDGIRWCVLTNGVTYRIYKSDELASADKKLLAEADLRQTSEPDGMAQVVKTLSLLSKESLAAGTLDEWGERVFVDVAVRAALDQLMKDQAPGLVNLVRKAIGGKYSAKQVRASLVRVATGKPQDLPKKTAPAPPLPPPYGEYSLEHHIGGKPQVVVDLYQQLDSKLLALGPDLSKRYRKQYINYVRGNRSVVTLRVWASRVDMYASIPFQEAPPLPADKVKDVTSIGHWGLGDTGYRIDGPEDVQHALELAAASYSRAQKKA